MGRLALRELAQRWQQQGRSAMWVEITRVKGSVPREDGTRMLVSAAKVAGTIGGGHLEWQAIARAQAALKEAGGQPLAAWDWPVTLGPSLGQCCGGALTLRFFPLDSGSLTGWAAEPPRFHLQLHGAGHVGRAIVKLLADLPCEALWVDEREDGFPAMPLPAHLRCCASAQPEEEVADAPAGAFFLVMTHSHALDFRICEAVLRRGDFGFLGLIGSASKKAGFLRRWRERGLSDAQLDRLVSPVGMPGIEGKAPEIIAVAVVAQLLQLASA